MGIRRVAKHVAIGLGHHHCSWHVASDERVRAAHSRLAKYDRSQPLEQLDEFTFVLFGHWIICPGYKAQRRVKPFDVEIVLE